MRGARGDQLVETVLVGIIPAYAGSTVVYLCIDRAPGDHPRVCGEHDMSRQKDKGTKGSSPRMRGARGPDIKAVAVQRIIPAYAGSTAAVVSANDRDWDHPRVCGEHELQPKAKALDLGSSPRMRGALDHRRVGLPMGGIIPAYAGSTAQTSHRSIQRQDHPRVCGEHETSNLH